MLTDEGKVEIVGGSSVYMLCMITDTRLAFQNSNNGRSLQLHASVETYEYACQFWTLCRESQENGVALLVFACETLLRGETRQRIPLKSRMTDVLKPDSRTCLLSEEDRLQMR